MATRSRLSADSQFAIRRQVAVRSWLKYLIAGAALMTLPLASGEATPQARAALLRIGVVLTTESPVADLTLDTGTIINASILFESGVRVRVEGNHLRFQRNGSGSAEGYVRVLVSGIEAGARLQWRLTLSPPAAPTEIEIYNENHRDRARLVDRFDAHAENRLREHGRSPIGRWADEDQCRAAAARPGVLLSLVPTLQLVQRATAGRAARSVLD